MTIPARSYYADKINSFVIGNFHFPYEQLLLWQKEMNEIITFSCLFFDVRIEHNEVNFHGILHSFFISEFSRDNRKKIMFV